MDVDSNEVDQTLLQQFSCMGTTDRDELIMQLQSLVGNCVNQETASFLLDMNNWNLQGAVCSYFDFEAPHKLPSMTLVRDITVGQGESIPPSTKFVFSWRVKNNGDAVWPPGCCLQFNGGDLMATAERVQVPLLEVEATTDISLEMLSPREPGIYESKFRMVTTSGAFFGDIIWVIVTVAEGGTMALTQQLQHLSDLGSSTSSVEPNANPFTASRTSSQITYQDSVQQSQEGDTNMMC